VRIRAVRRGLVALSLGALVAVASVVPGVSAEAATRVLCHAANRDGAGSFLPPQGSFVVGGARVWEVVGCALVYVPSWTTFGGRHPITTLSISDFNAAASNQVADGTFIRTLQDGAVYRMIGGAPTYVSTWAPFGGTRPAVGIDSADVANAGAGYPWHAIASSPSSLTQSFVRTESGRVFEIADGTPLYVTSWMAFGGPRPTILIDEAAVTRAGQAGVWRFLHATLADGTFILGVIDPGIVAEIYRIAGGAPIYLPSLANLPEVDLRIRISLATIDRAGSGTFYNHLRAQPADGTFLFGINGSTGSPGIPTPTGNMYWTSGGAAIPVTNAANCPPGAVDIQDASVVKAGQGGRYNHLAPLPAHPPTPPC
jgi:hypothetical protein